MNTDIAYFRGLVGARLANKDNWIFIIAGSKEFLLFMRSRPMPTLGGELVITPHALVAGDIAGNPELWVMIVAQPKATSPIEVKRERREMVRALRRFGQKGSIRPDQDILVLLEPNAPKWAGRLVANYMEFIRTGEGAMKPPMTASPNAYCIAIPSTGFHTHCVGPDAALAFKSIKEELITRPFEVLTNPTQCMLPNQRLSGTFRYHGEPQP